MRPTTTTLLPRTLAEFHDLIEKLLEELGLKICSGLFTSLSLAFAVICYTNGLHHGQPWTSQAADNLLSPSSNLWMLDVKVSMLSMLILPLELLLYRMTTPLLCRLLWSSQRTAPRYRRLWILHLPAPPLHH